MHLVRRLYPDIPAVFVDTGLEYPELRKFVKEVENVIWLKPDMNFKKVIATYGYPLLSKTISHNVSIAKRNPNGKVKKNMFNPNKRGQYAMYKWSFMLEAPFNISDKCCDIMKKKPAYKFQKENNMFPILGTMATESTMRRENWMKHGCNAFDIEHPKSQPMSFWTEQDVLEYILRYDLQYASVYGDIVRDKKGKYHTTGCQRTGCVFCGFGCHLEKEPNRFQRLKETHPKLWEYCMKPWNDGGLGMKEVLEFIGVKIE